MAEHYLLADERHVDFDGQEVLVDHGNLVILEPQDPVVDIKFSELLFVDAHKVLLLSIA